MYQTKIKDDVWRRASFCSTIRRCAEGLLNQLERAGADTSFVERLA